LWCHSNNISMVMVIKVQNLAHVNIKDDMTSTNYNYSIEMSKYRIKAIRTSDDIIMHYCSCINPLIYVPTWAVTDTHLG